MLAVLALGFGAAVFLAVGTFLGAAALVVVFFCVSDFLGRPGDLTAVAFCEGLGSAQPLIRLVQVKLQCTLAAAGLAAGVVDLVAASFFASLTVPEGPMQCEP